MASWDHSSHQQFYDYYASESESDEALQRFRSIRDSVLRIFERKTGRVGPLEIVDIGCGAGTQSILWAEAGHHVHALDVNRPLLELAKERAVGSGHVIDFQLGSALELPWPEQSMDVCLVVELLEHVKEWERCLAEFTRVLKPGGVLLLTTTNKLCPVQQEFNLPFYSWYPSFMKHYFEHLAVTTRPQLANFAKYPAVNWFSYYSLRKILAAHGFCCLDRFDVMDLSEKSFVKSLVGRAVQKFPLLRWSAHVATPGTIVLGMKHGGWVHESGSTDLV